MRPVEKSWRLLPHDPAAIERISREHQVPSLIASILINRGLNETAAIRRFLAAPLVGLHPPEQLPGVPEAAQRIWSAVQAKRRICLYGDYDVDGTTGTAILLQTLTVLSATVEFYVPNRLDEGYGLNCEAIRQLHAGGVELLVSIDCGISALEEAAEAKRLGIELIITDHHEFKSTLPDAACLVHPRLPGTNYPFGDLSGAGVALKLAWAIGQLASGGAKVATRLREVLLDSVALAALGLVADVVPLHDENRILVKHGLNRLMQQPTPGMKALIVAAGLGEAKVIRAEDIAFKLGPRINAAGRLGCARLVVDLLTTPSEQRATDLATYLEGQNKERQQTERKVAHEAREMLAAGGYENDPGIVLASPDWHAGVIGIVAGRLAEQFGKPTLIVSLGAEFGSGSGRSVVGFALHEALAACNDELLSHGGHAAAAGFRVHPDRIDALRGRFKAVVAERFPGGPPPPELTIDAEVPLASLTASLVRDLDRLEPYGACNPRPKFLAAGLEIVGEPKAMGGGERHLSFRVKQGKTTLRAVGWNMAERIPELMGQGGKCCVAFVPKINVWNNYTNVEMEVADFQAGERARLS